jgi:uncharacterized protein DUF2721
MRKGGRAFERTRVGYAFGGTVDPAGSNPFAILTAVVAPAILTNASSVLALGTSNRLARVVDRRRVVAKELAGIEPGAAGYASSYRNLAAQLERLQVRTQLLVKALRAFYASLGLFASAALLSVVGSIVTYYGERALFQLAAGLALLAGAVAVVGLAWGCTLMVHETRFAVKYLAEEAQMSRP